MNRLPPARICSYNAAALEETVNTRPLQLLGLIALLALQVAAPGVASWHGLTAHHYAASTGKHTAVISHVEQGECQLCELSRHAPQRLTGPEQATIALSFEMLGRPLAQTTSGHQPLGHPPYAPRAPPLS